MSNYKHVYKMKVLEGHLDSFGHMNNATYLEILEEARWDLITNRGYGYKEIHKTKIGPVILEVNLKFRKELKLREDIVIETHMLNYDKRVGTILQEIKGMDGDIRAVAEFKVALFDMKERKIIAPTEEWLHAIGMK